MSLTLSVCPAVCLSQIWLLLFLFLDGIEPFLGHYFTMTPSTKRCSDTFDLGLLKPEIYSPKFAQTACTTDRPEMFGPTWGFSGMADSMQPYKMWADHCCYGNEIWARRGDPFAYRLVSDVCLCVYVVLQVSAMMTEERRFSVPVSMTRCHRIDLKNPS